MTLTTPLVDAARACVPLRSAREDSAAGSGSGGELALLGQVLTRRLHDDLRDPVRVDRKGRGPIRVMRGIEIAVDSDSCSIDVRGRSGPAGDDWLNGTLGLDRPLSGPNWARAWWWVVRTELPANLRALGDSLVEVELPDRINAAARRSGLLLAARRKVIAALRLDPRLLDWARALSHDGDVGSWLYEIVWCNEWFAQQRLHEAPALWPLYAATRIPLEHDFDEVKCHLRERGLTRGGWRVLCRHGRAVWWPLRHCHEFGRKPEREIVIQANLAAAIGRGELPPAALRLALGRLGSMNLLLRREALLRPPIMAAWRQLDRLADPAGRSAFVRGPLDVVLANWLLRDGLVEVPRGAGWRWFVTAMSAAHETVVAPNRRRRSFGKRRVIDGYTIVPLRTIGAVQAAGMSMRNCLASPASLDDPERPALFAIRTAQGKLAAMFSARPGCRESTLVEIRGRCNRPVPPALEAIARAYLATTRATPRSSRRGGTARGCDAHPMPLPHARHQAQAAEGGQGPPIRRPNVAGAATPRRSVSIRRRRLP